MLPLPGASGSEGFAPAAGPFFVIWQLATGMAGAPCLYLSWLAGWLLAGLAGLSVWLAGRLLAGWWDGELAGP